jgi:hypothetical protein
MGHSVMYYTYAHLTPQGEIFYIGKGMADRAYSFSDRSHAWKRAVKENQGVQIEILANWNTEEEAFSHEKLLIDCFIDMKYKLVNKTKGGKGAYGVVWSEERKQKLSQRMLGHKYKLIICPKCKTSGGATTMKRWHFDNCTGKKSTFKARVSYNNKRIYLGYFATQQEADQKCIDFYASVNKPLPKEFIRHKGTL